MFFVIINFSNEVGMGWLFWSDKSLRSYRQDSLWNENWRTFSLPHERSSSVKAFHLSVTALSWWRIGSIVSFMISIGKNKSAWKQRKMHSENFWFWFVSCKTTILTVQIFIQRLVSTQEITRLILVFQNAQVAGLWFDGLILIFPSLGSLFGLIYLFGD